MGAEAEVATEREGLVMGSEVVVATAEKEMEETAVAATVEEGTAREATEEAEKAAVEGTEGGANTPPGVREARVATEEGPAGAVAAREREVEAPAEVARELAVAATERAERRRKCLRGGIATAQAEQQRLLRKA